MPTRPFLFYVVLTTTLLIVGRADAQGYSLDEAVGRMTVVEGFDVTLVAGEPDVRQPILVKFDDRGRLWVIQYLQYPNPAGLKRVTVDRYSRTTYDRVPEPPPLGPRGEDRITILEDTDGDGRADRFQDFVDGLNLTTGLEFGHGGVYVIQVPYLLFYPDHDRDDVPDGDPVVCLKGFGMEDAQSFANHLTWGPDGWLYGLNGSTTTCRIRGIEFQQGVWRYHPLTDQFELFCEGGGNVYGLTFNHEGQLFYSSNGSRPAYHGIQGAYYDKNFGKHGQLHNPYAFGYFGYVPHEDYRGGHVTCGGVFYYGDTFPSSFRGSYIANNLLAHEVHWHHFTANGSTFRSRREGELVRSNDTWCAPTDLIVGPDGAIYFCDFHDKRTAHPDPDADWDRTNGRVYRIQAQGAGTATHVDLNRLTSQQLIDMLGTSNLWYVRRALRILAERRDPRVVPQLRRLAVDSEDDQLALHALWALNLSGGLDDEIAGQLLEHRSAAVRNWTVRLLGDPKLALSDPCLAQLVALARNESSAVVRSQLAATCQRLPAAQALPIVWELLQRDEDRQDPCIPLQLWWAVESQADEDPDRLLEMFSAADAWQSPMIRETILGRLMRRYAAVGTLQAQAACGRLLASAPNDAERSRMLSELDLGLGGAAGDAVSDELLESLSQFVMPQSSTSPLLLSLALRSGMDEAHERIVLLATDRNASTGTRVQMVQLLGQYGRPDCVPRILRLLHTDEQHDVEAATLQALARFDDDRVADKILGEYPRFSAKLQRLARQALFSRGRWALAFLQGIDAGRFDPQAVALEELRRLHVFSDDELKEIVKRHWRQVSRETPEEKLAEIRHYNNDLRAASGNARVGHGVYKQHCAKCHKLFGEGEDVGPDLTRANRQDQNYLLTSIVDPSSFIRVEYLSSQVLTTDGRILVGLVQEETPNSITLMNSSAEKVQIPRDSIDEMNASDVSQMPEGLLKPLTPQQRRDLLAYLRADGPVPADATVAVATAGEEPEREAKFQRPTYDVRRASGPITLDGRLDEAAWHEAANMGPFHFTWWNSGQKKQTVAKLLWDDENFYVGHICQDEFITARFDKHDDPVAKDDCFEVMLAPDPDRPDFYFNIEWNVRGAYIDGHRAHGPQKPSVPWVAEGVRIAGTHSGTLNDDSDQDQWWACEVAIPFANFAKHMPHTPPQPGDRWNLNLNRHGGDTNLQYSQWSRADTPNPSFHTPHRFGQVIFVDQRVEGEPE